MRYANYNGTDRSVTADEFHGLAGPEFRQRGIFPYCQQCGEAVFPSGVHNPNIPSRFDHYNFPPNADPYDDCPFANRQRARFVGVRPRLLDNVAGADLRALFFEDQNLRLAYQFMHRTAGGTGRLSVELFGTIIERADRRRIWAYAGLPLWCVPYVLMTVAQFRAPHFDFHFGFAKPPGPVDVLWQHQRRSYLASYFSDSGREIERTRLAVSEAAYRAYAAPQGRFWVTENLAVRLRAFHGQGG